MSNPAQRNAGASTGAGTKSSAALTKEEKLKNALPNSITGNAKGLTYTNYPPEEVEVLAADGRSKIKVMVQRPATEDDDAIWELEKMDRAKVR